MLRPHIFLSMISKFVYKPFIRNTWDFIIVALTAILAIYLPLKLALGEQLTFYTGLEIALTLFFVIDLYWLLLQSRKDE